MTTEEINKLWEKAQEKKLKDEDIKKHIIKQELEDSEKEETNLPKEWKNIFKKNKLKYSKDNNYKLECGHTKIGIINLYPFEEMFCLECGFKSNRIIELKGGIKE